MSHLTGISGLGERGAGAAQPAERQTSRSRGTFPAQFALALGTSNVRLLARGYVRRPTGRAPPVDRAWTARGKRWRVYHRLPTPLPTGSTLGTHTHRHTQQV
ncbi:hypothetical protein NKW53_14830 [Acetobacter orientalis]|uniref:hypothetical protein n=1 Tax=Acetobacter orientalis TaxID=146474 RepID=UPI0020A1AFF8|nr:hypothetical protein [Acetobacter orientalis]MCP1217311.1 hypothetical protein [Acetobacter orientalis]MCP1220200.1 hypothetical protein [Acetobacter orientalis]